MPVDRLGIFVFYDPQGIVDAYVEYLLHAMRQVCTRIIAVCNGTLESRSREKLEHYCESIYIRDNHGLDGGALQDYFVNLSKPDEWNTADELVWFNDTCYGPFFPMEDVFNKMNRNPNLDFWGITAHSSSNSHWEGENGALVGEHLQTYFITIRKNLLHAEEFLQFWNGMPKSDSFHNTVSDYELQMTDFFASRGYRYGVLCDTRALDTNPEFVMNPMAENCYGLIARMHCPFLKRKTLLLPKMQSLLYTGGEQVQRCLRYIREETDYDLNLIFTNLIRRYEESLWKGNVCLDWILPEMAIPDDNPIPSSLILAEADHEDTVEELKEFVSDLPEKCTLTFLTRSEIIAKYIREQIPFCHVALLSDCPKGLYGMLKGLSVIGTGSAEVVCILQELWGNPVNGIHILESSRRYGELQNLLAGKDYIRNLLAVFRQYPLLGLLEPPETLHTMGKSTPLGDFFPEVRQLASKFGEIVPKDVSTIPVVQGPCLWCRTSAIAPILSGLEEIGEFSKDGILEKAISYIIQSFRYCSGTVMEQSYAALEWENRKFMAAKGWSEQDKRKEIMGLIFGAAERNAGYNDSPEYCLSEGQLYRLLFLTGKRVAMKRMSKKSEQNLEGIAYLSFRDVKRLCSERGTSSTAEQEQENFLKMEK